MRIALVVERFEPTGGGVESAVWQIAHGLADCGDDVHVFARQSEPTPALTLHATPVPTFWQPLRVSLFSSRTRRALEGGSFDIVHSFSRTRHQDIFHAGGGSHADSMLRTYGSTAAQLRRASPRHALQLALEKRIFSDPRQLIQCVSAMVRDEISLRYGVEEERLAIVPYGVDAPLFAPEAHREDRETLRRRFATADANVWLLAGSGWRRKGLDTALRALAACESASDVLWVAGRDRPDSWRRLAAELGVAKRVHFLGPRDDMPRIYAASDGLFLPTRYDAFGLVLLEAAASGLPVVTAGTAGAAPLVASAGQVVADPEDVEAFAAALNRLGDPQLRKTLGERGREIARRHDWKSTVEQLRALYARWTR